MYHAYIMNGSEKSELFYSGDNRLALIDPVLSLKLNYTGKFAFSVPATHPCWDKLISLVTRVKVFQDKELLYAGRVVYIEEDFYKTRSVECEGELGYMLDSVVRPFEYEGSMGGLFRQLVESHNSQVEESKRFEVGELSASSVAEQVKYSVKDAVKTYKFIMANILTIQNTYIRARYVGEKKYVDLVSDYGGENRQPIRFGENLLDLSKKNNPDSIMTALVPYGAQMEDDTLVDIKSVNGGKDIIYHDKGVRKYGIITGTQKWDDVTDPAVLLEKAKAYLNESLAITESDTEWESTLPTTIDLTAVDLSMVSVKIEKLKLGKWTTIESPPHGIKKKFLLSEQDIYLTDPRRNKITLGGKVSTLTQNMANNNIKIDQALKNVSSEIISKIANATNLITGGKGGYVVLDIDDPDTGKRSLPWRILIMDAPEKDKAKSVIQINKNGIGFSTTGINGPYRNAWTIDGNLVADFITAGTMLADRIRGGILEIGGKGIGRDGRIVVKDANDKEIGYWDKTGFHVLLGVIEGSEIRGSSIIGGMIDIGSGLFYVDDDIVQFGDWYVSTGGENLLRSNDGSVVIQTGQGGPFGNYPILRLSDDSGTTEITDHGMSINHILARDINFTDTWTEGVSALDMFKDLYGKISDLNRKIENLEG